MLNKTIFSVLILVVPFSAHSGWLDSLSTVVGGHITDIQSRFTDDQVIEGTVIQSASFRDNDRGQDMLHHGSGSVKIIQTAEARYLQLAKDFSSTPGPDYHVYISNDTGIDHEELFVKANQIELGRLIKGSGASYYKIPDATDFQSVTIWCKAFNEFIMSADFKQ